MVYKEIWMQRLVAAKAKWSKLSEQELMASEGKRQELIRLVQRRYSVSRKVASKQVSDFLCKNETSFTLTA